LSANNVGTLSGDITVNGGNLRITTNTALGSTAKIILNGGAFWRSTANSDGVDYAITNTIVLGVCGGTLMDLGESWARVHYSGNIGGTGRLGFTGSTRGTWIEGPNNDWSGGTYIAGMEWVWCASNSTLGTGPVCIDEGWSTSEGNSARLYLTGDRNVATNQMITMLAQDSVLLLISPRPQLGSIEGNGEIILGLNGYNQYSFVYSRGPVTPTVGLDNRDAEYFGDILQYYYPEFPCGLVKAGTGTWTLWGNVWVNGGVTVTNGTLQVNNCLDPNSVVTVGPGATLAGIGTVGTVTNNGGTIAPGFNGAGTLYVRGSLMLSTGATLRINLAGVGTNTALHVTGSAAIGGNLTVVEAPGWQPHAGQQWTILAATNGISGTFANRLSDYSLTVSGSDLVLSRRNKGTAIVVR
jgi:hypothetical protein